MIHQAHKERFLTELTAGEKTFFLKTAQEGINTKRYRPSEDLFHYCYFMTMRERMRTISPSPGEGLLRILLVEGTKDIDNALKLYRERLEKTRGSVPDPSGRRFIEYFTQ